MRLLSAVRFVLNDRDFSRKLATVHKPIRRWPRCGTNRRCPVTPEVRQSFTCKMAAVGKRHLANGTDPWDLRFCRQKARTFDAGLHWSTICRCSVVTSIFCRNTGEFIVTVMAMSPCLRSTRTVINTSFSRWSGDRWADYRFLLMQPTLQRIGILPILTVMAVH